MSPPLRALAAALCLALAACPHAPPKVKNYASLLDEGPRSILVVPAVSRAIDVTAPGLYLSTVSIPLGERGYYVFPVHLVRRLLEEDGLSDADLVHGADPVRLANLFGADAVLYVTIRRWDAQYLVLSTQVTVAVSYVLKSGRTGATLWAEHRTATYSSGNGGNGGGGGAAGLLAQLIVMAVDAAVTKASPSFLPLARSANADAFAWPGPGLPAGPYLSSHGKDLVPEMRTSSLLPSDRPPRTSRPAPGPALAPALVDPPKPAN